jgi:hypothetical protein
MPLVRTRAGLPITVAPARPAIPMSSAGITLNHVRQIEACTSTRWARCSACSAPIVAWSAPSLGLAVLMLVRGADGLRQRQSPAFAAAVAR